MRGIHSRKPITWEEKENGCWECTSHAPNKKEYRYRKIRRKSLSSKKIYIHRLIYEECFGEIPDGMDVCHRCDNPSCINPEHLFLGTASDNTQDMLKKGRGNKARGSRNGMARLKESDVIEIFHYLKNGDSPSEIAKRYNVHNTTIGKIKAGVNWKWLKGVV
jgi:hypothetical protein